MSMIMGMKLFVDPNCMKDSKVRTFPKRQRSARLNKKMIKRFGGEFKKEPAIYMTHNAVICHPIFESEIRQGMRSANHQSASLATGGWASGGRE